MANHAGDLLSGGLGSKQNEGSGESSSPSSPATGNGIVGNTTHDNTSVGDNLITKSAGTGTETPKSVSEPKQDDSSVKAEPKASTDSVKDPSTWTIETALKEVKKSREEAKQNRIKYQEMVKSKEESFTTVLEAKEAEYQEALEAKKKLESLEKSEADKKRSLEEKVQYRDKELAEANARAEATEKAYKAQLETASSQIRELAAEREAQLTVYKERLDEELVNISEDKREIANLIVKGAGDARDALIALNEAKLKGIFEEKQVVVSHAVPGAQDGARVTQKQLDAAEKDRRGKLSSQDLIREGLKQAGSVSTPKSNRNSIL